MSKQGQHEDSESANSEVNATRRPRRRWMLLVGLAACAAGVAVGVALVGADGSPSTERAAGSDDDSPQAAEKIVYGSPLEEFPAENASDIVSWSDQVAVVKAVKSEELPDKREPAQAAAGEGMISRNTTFEVEDVLWNRSDTPELAAGGTFATITTGWVEADFKRFKFVTEGSTYIEDGSHYVMAMVFDKDEWAPLVPSAIFPVEADEASNGGDAYSADASSARQDAAVKPARTQISALAKWLRGRSLDQAATVFKSARVDPLVAEHLDEPLGERGKSYAAELRVREAKNGAFQK